MAVQDRETYKYLQIDRPILAGGDRLLAAIGKIGERVLGLSIATSLTETHLDIDEDKIDLRTIHQPVSRSRLDVYSPHDLKVVLLRRVASNRMGNRYNFNYQAASLTAKRKTGSSRTRGVPSQRSGKNAQDALNNLSTEQGLPAGNTRIKFDRVTEGFDPILGQFVALIPRGGRERFVLMAQAKKAYEELDELSPRIANGANPAIPIVPFASLPHGISPKQHERLMDEINNSAILPVSLVMGGVDIYTNSTVARQNGYSPEDE